MESVWTQRALGRGTVATPTLVEGRDSRGHAALHFGADGGGPGLQGVTSIAHAEVDAQVLREGRRGGGGGGGGRRRRVLELLVLEGEALLHGLVQLQLVLVLVVRVVRQSWQEVRHAGLLSPTLVYSSLLWSTLGLVFSPAQRVR